jgi:hypothetical protein
MKIDYDESKQNDLNHSLEKENKAECNSIIGNYIKNINPEKKQPAYPQDIKRKQTCKQILKDRGLK